MKTDAIDEFIREFEKCVSETPYPIQLTNLRNTEILVNELAALKARIAELEAERTWKPIESAPKRTNVIVSIHGVDPFIASNRANKYIQWVDGSGNQINNPTHWMPLPPAPKED